MKQCYKCKEVYPITFFKFRNKTKGIKFSYCNKCMISYRKMHYQNNRQYYLDKAHKRNGRVRIERTKFLIDYLTKHPCIDCGNNNPIVLEFDHKEEKEKDFNVSSVLIWGSIDRILKEIEKCEIRCANCHKIKTAKQHNWLKATNFNGM